MRNRTKLLVAINILIAANFAADWIATRYAKESEWENALGMEEHWPIEETATECLEEFDIPIQRTRCMQSKGWIYLSKQEQANNQAHFYTCLTQRKEIDEESVDFSNDAPWRLRFNSGLPLTYYGNDLIRWWLYTWRDSKAIFFGNHGHGGLWMKKGTHKGLKLEIALTGEDDIITTTFMECQPDNSRTDNLAPLELYQKSLPENNPVASQAIEDDKEFRVDE